MSRFCIWISLLSSKTVFSIVFDSLNVKFMILEKKLDNLNLVIGILKTQLFSLCHEKDMLQLQLYFKFYILKS